MNDENLTVSWHLPSQLADKEYVVEYKQAGSPLGQGFDWVRVNKGHAMGIFKGLSDLDIFIAIPYYNTE